MRMTGAGPRSAWSRSAWSRSAWTVADGQVILSGAPRTGKSAIAVVIQQEFDGVWMNLGVDLFMQATPGA